MRGTEAAGRSLPTPLMPSQSEWHRLYFTASKWSVLTNNLHTQPNNQQTSGKSLTKTLREMLLSTSVSGGVGRNGETPSEEQHPEMQMACSPLCPSMDRASDTSFNGLGRSGVEKTFSCNRVLMRSNGKILLKYLTDTFHALTLGLAR